MPLFEKALRIGEGKKFKEFEKRVARINDFEAELELDDDDELKARYEIALEQYIKTINIEGQLMVLMANRYILPAAYKYQGQVAGSVAAVKAAGSVSKEAKKTLDDLVKLGDVFKQKTDKLQALLEHESDGGVEKHAKFFRDKVVPAMESLRETGDSLEAIVPHEGWPLPTYREMLFIR